MKAITLGLASLLMLGPTSGCGADNKTKIVGVWEPLRGNVKGTTIEFTKDGKFKAFEQEGKKEMGEGTYEVDGESINIVGKRADGKEHKETVKIKKLTRKELVTEDEKGKEDEFKRVD